MNLFAVTGNPILHSKSPNIFNTVFQKDNIDAAYFRLAADDAEEAIHLLKSLSLKGMNVTAPYKADVMPYLDEIDPEAEKINAVNTIVNINGKLKGYNTDHIGVTESFKDNGIQLKNKKCIIIGAGGAGRAAVYGLHKAGAEVMIIDIAEDVAKKVAGEFNCTAKPYHDLEDCVRTSDIIVYAVDAATVKVLKEEWLNPEQVIYDVNYKPSFLTELAKEKGCKMVTGAEMLINQAMPGFKYYMGYDADKQIMWNGFNTGISNKKKNTIALIGFMGTGKTSVGKALAQMIDYQFIDLDVEIEKKSGMRISDIFKIKGETGFRKIEQEVLKQVISKTKVILSCGGGAVINPDHRQILKENAIVVWLYNSVVTSVTRGNDGTRPLLNVEKPIEAAEKLFNSRIGFYADTADLLVNTENKSIEKIAEKIYAENNKTFGSKG